MTADDTYQVWAAGYDGDGNYISDINCDWATTGTLDGVAGTNVNTITFAPVTAPTSGTITAADTATGTFTDATGTITVNVGALASIVIEDAAGGTGTEVDTHTMTADDTYQVWAAGYDADNNYISDVNCDWGNTGNLDAVTDTNTITITFDPVTAPTSGTLTAQDTGTGAFTDATGTITVNVGALDSITIEDAAGGAGSEITTHTMTADDTFQVWAAGYDADGNYRQDEPCDWTVTGTLDAQTATNVNTFTFDPSTAYTSGTITATDFVGGTINDATGQIDVDPGALAFIVVRDQSDGAGTAMPAHTMIADDTYQVWAAGYDAEWNYRQDEPCNWATTGTLDGQTANGVNTFTFNPSTAPTIGTFTATDSVGGTITNATDTITVNPGALNYILVRDASGGAGSEVTTHTMTADDTFPVWAAGYDAENNYRQDENCDWAVTGNLDTQTSTNTNTFTFNPSTAPTVGTIIAADTATGTFTDNTGLITVNPGTLAQVIIRDAPGNGGSEVTTHTMTADDTYQVWAAGYDAEANYLGHDVNCNWGTTGTLDGQVANDVNTFTFDPVTAPTGGTITAGNTSNAGINDATGTITVNQGALDHIIIMDAANNAGSEVITHTMTTDEFFQVWSAGFDADDNFISDVNCDWTVSRGIGTLTPTGNTQTTVFDATTIGTGRIWANDTATGTFMDSTGDITVLVGTLDHVIIEDAPGGHQNWVNNVNLPADNVLTVYSAGYDSDGNYFGAVNGDWTTQGGLELQTSINTNQFSFDPSIISNGTIFFDDLAGHDDVTGPIWVGAGGLSYIIIRDAPNNGGGEITDVNMNATFLLLFAAGYDAEDNYRGDEPCDWTVTGGIGTFFPLSFNTPNTQLNAVPGTGKVWANDTATSSVSDSTGLITVNYHPVKNQHTVEFFDTIQEAVDDVDTLAGHNILVDTGPYFENLWLHKGVNLVGNGAANTWILGDSTNGVIYVDSDGGSISGITVISSGYSYHSAILLDNAHNWTIYDNNLSYVGYGINAVGLCSHNNYSNNLFEYDSFGIRLEAHGYNQIHGNLFMDCGIGIESDDPRTYCQQTIPTTNTVNGAPIYYYSNANMNNATVPQNAGQVILGNVWWLVVDGITPEPAGDGLVMGFCRYVTVNNSIFQDQDFSTGICMYNCYDCLFDNDTFEFNNYGVYVWNCWDCEFTDGTFTGNQDGIYLTGSHDITIQGNHFIDNIFSGISLCDGSFENNIFINIFNGSFFGIFGETASYNNIMQNSIWYCWDGLYLAMSHNNTLMLNIILHNDNGIYLMSSVDNMLWNNDIAENDHGVVLNWSNYNIIAWNNISHNDLNGIFAWLSEGNMIHNNSFALNWEGVELLACSFNIFNHNVFHANGNHSLWIHNWQSKQNRIWANVFLRHGAQDDTGQNHWNLSLPIGGNFWRGWTTPDDDNNGFVDQRYRVDGWYTFDRYPLAQSPIAVVGLPPVLTATPGDEQVNLSWEKPQDFGGALILQYRIYRGVGVNGSGNETLLVVLGDSNTSYIDDSLINGEEYHYYITMVNLVAESRPSNRVLAVPEGAAPTVEITSPINGFNTNANSIRVEWTGSDAESGIARYAFQINGGPWIQKGMATFHDIASGHMPYTVTVKAFDIASNFATDTVNFNVDKVAPTVVIDSPAANALIDTDATTIQYTGADIDSGIDHYMLKLDNGAWVDNGLTTSNLYENLEEGGHTVSVKVYDLAGNDFTTTVGFTIDTFAPDVSISSPYDDQIFNTENITMTWYGSDTTTGLEHFEVRLDGNAWIQKAQLTSHEFSMVDDGYHSIYVRAYDMTGNYESATVHVTIDTINPAVSIQTPLDSSEFNTTSVVVTWTGSDMGSGMDYYSIRLDGRAWTNVGLATSRTLSSLSDGTHEIRVRAFDEAGNKNTDLITIMIDTLPPVLDIPLDFDGSIFNTSNVFVDWEGSDEHSGIARYNLKLDSETWFSVGPTSQYTLTSVSDGDHQLDIMAEDNAGNTVTKSALFMVDTIRPDMDIGTPSNNANINARSATVRWEAEDDTSGLAFHEARINEGGWVDVDQSTSKTYTALQEGATYTVDIRTHDMAGNTRLRSVSFTIDTVPPALGVSYPTGNTIITSSSIKIRWDSVDTVSGIDRFQVRIDEGEWEEITPTRAGVEASFTFSTLSDGGHVVDIISYDNAGNSVAQSVNFVVDVTPPTIRITDPVKDQAVRTTGYYVDWTGMDATSGIDRYEFHIYENGSYGSPIDMGTKTTYHLTALEDGSQRVMVMAFDKAGNSEETSVTFLVDTIPPSISISSPENKKVTNSSSITVAWTGSDLNSGLKGYQIKLDTNKWKDMGLSTSYTYEGVGEGEHSIEVKAIDNAGNQAQAVVRVTVDKTPPLVEEHSPSGSNVAVETSITVKFYEEMDEDRTYISIPGVPGTTTWLGATATFNPNIDLGYGTNYEVRVTGEDVAGNTLEPYTFTFTTTNIGTISGKALDKDGEPMANARVYTDTGESTTTDSNGNFKLNVPAGFYTVTISKVGYEDQKIDVTVSAGGMEDTGEVKVLDTEEEVPFYETEMCMMLALVLIIVVIVVAIAMRMKRKRK